MFNYVYDNTICYLLYLVFNLFIKIQRTYYIMIYFKEINYYLLFFSFDIHIDIEKIIVPMVILFDNNTIWNNYSKFELPLTNIIF